jgi:hypothetical protein
MIKRKAIVHTELPSKFTELARFLPKWEKRDTNGRYAERLASSMDELQVFHDAVMGRAEEIKHYLDSKPFADFGEQDRRLARLMFAFGTIAAAVEAFKRPSVPDTGAAAFYVAAEPEL